MDLGERCHYGKRFEFSFRCVVGRLDHPFIDIDIKVCITFGPLNIFICIFFVRSLFFLLNPHCMFFRWSKLWMLYLLTTDFEIREFY